MTPRERVKQALRHIEPDRVPGDFMATPEVWAKMVDHLGPPGTRLRQTAKAVCEDARQIAGER